MKQVIMQCTYSTRLKKTKTWKIFCGFYFCGAEADRRKRRNKVTAEKTTYTVTYFRQAKTTF
jgi:hypothetical protein